MRTALDEDPEDQHPDAREFVQEVRRYGWMAMHIYAGEDAPAFTYTTGLWVNRGIPELILFALGQDTAHSIMTQLVNEAERGIERPIGKPFSGLLERFDACLFPTSPAKHANYLLRSVWFYDTPDFACLQLVLPDRTGKFPWQDGFNRKLLGDQPDLSERGWLAELAH